MEGNTPIGGKWSYDEDNRKKLPKGIKIPTTKLSSTNKYISKLSPIVNKIFKDNVGSVNNFWLPSDRDSCQKFLDEFLKNKFSLFGDYEDALSADNEFLFHSVLSPILNLGLVTPNELLNKAKKYQDKININSFNQWLLISINF